VKVQKRLTSRLPLVLDVLLYPEEDYIVAHCLQLDIVATAPTKREAFGDMIDLIVAQIEYALENDNMAHLFRPAPPELWERFYALHSKGTKAPYAIKRQAVLSSVKVPTPSILPVKLRETELVFA